MPHEDHLDQAAQKQLHKDMPVPLPKQDLKKVQDYGFKHLLALKPGDKQIYPEGENTVSIPQYQPTTVRIQTYCLY